MAWSKPCPFTPLEGYSEMKPEEDIYKCVRRDCNKFHKFGGDNTKYMSAFHMSINYMQFQRSAQLISSIPKQDLDFKEILDVTFSGLSGGWKISYMDLRMYANEYGYDVSEDVIVSYLDFVAFVADMCPPELIKKFIKTSYLTGAFRLTKILLDHFPENERECDLCFICCTNANIDLIDSPCVCKLKIHIPCLIQLVQQCGNKCMTCHTTLHAQLDSRKRIIFPKSGIYAAPLMSNYVIIKNDDKIQKLLYAIINLQISIIQEILGSMSDIEFRLYYDNVVKHLEQENSHSSIFALLNISDKKTLKLIDYLPSNLPRSKFPFEYSVIEGLLNSKYS